MVLEESLKKMEKLLSAILRIIRNTVSLKFYMLTEESQKEPGLKMFFNSHKNENLKRINISKIIFKIENIS